MALQAIVTKFLGPTNSRGARVKASCEAGSLTVSWDHSLGIPENHDTAARALVHKLGWDSHHYGRWTLGALPRHNSHAYALVCVVKGRK